MWALLPRFATPTKSANSIATSPGSSESIEAVNAIANANTSRVSRSFFKVSICCPCTSPEPPMLHLYPETMQESLDSTLDGTLALWMKGFALILLHPPPDAFQRVPGRRPSLAIGA